MPAVLLKLCLKADHLWLIRTTLSFASPWLSSRGCKDGAGVAEARVCISMFRDLRTNLLIKLPGTEIGIVVCLGIWSQPEAVGV